MSFRPRSWFMLQVANLYQGMLALSGALPAIEGAKAAQECQMQQLLQAQAALLEAHDHASQKADK